MKPMIRIALILALVVVLAVAVMQIAAGEDQGPGNQVLQRALDIELGKVQPRVKEALVSSGPVYAMLQASGELERRADAAQGDSKKNNTPASATAGCPNKYIGGGTKGGRNIKVNQDCSLRRQAEEVIAVNPTNPLNLIAGQNDSRIGFNHCGYAWSMDGGKTWGDMVPPFWQFLMADGHTADACSDPTATFDADGNAYVGGVLFDVASAASAFVVAKSNAGLGGSFYHTPAPLSFQEYRNVPLGVVASDNNPAIFHDKEFIVADASQSSPKVNNVYATWTRFSATNSPIYFSQSTTGGATWSPGVEISGANSAFCTVFSGSANPNACDQDQGSHPIVGKDGTIYVAFGNGNTPNLGVNQVMMVSCPAGADCSSSASWTAPVKVGDLIGTHPFGPSSAGCPAGRQCLPPNGYRVPEFTSISASVDNSGKLFVSWADSRNLGSNCNPLGSAATATPPCDNDVFYAYSTDGGASWSSTVQLTPAGSAQWQPWSAVVANGSKLWVAYYDRSYGNCEFDGCNDITLAAVSNPASASPSVSFTRLTTSSMPNLTPANNPVQAGFLGDYMWVTVDNKGRPHVVWADTRGLGGTVEEDIYYATYP
ncbi:MAG TPA: hypothetical protein VI755_06995 [Anaerolineales bacterium]|nr:hypothetical protein [Anaerolineales bacterium]